jgi:hypothetical protein
MDLTGIGSAATAISSIVGKFWPDKTQEEKDRMALVMLQAQGEINANVAQVQVDQVEAGSKSVFVSGWRPFVGWVCGSACAWNWVGLPIANFVAAMLHRPLALAPADLTQMLPLLMGMLGMGALRTYEKLNGVAAK